MDTRRRREGREEKIAEGKVKKERGIKTNCPKTSRTKMNGHKEKKTAKRR